MSVTLVILAAGMGSRFGGLKQMEGIGPNGEVLADYSVYDAKRAGFDKVVYIIKPEMEEDFVKKVASRISFIDWELAYQKMDDLPSSFKGADISHREKPWGTSHALLSCKNIIKEPFVVINADDYYGVQIYKDLYDFLTTTSDTKNYFHYGLAGYKLKETISDNGSVSRGVCSSDNGFLTDITEMTKIVKEGTRIISHFNDKIIELSPDTLVSMNAFAFRPSVFDEIEQGLAEFLKENINSPKAEYYLPMLAQNLIKAGKAKFSIIPALDKWYGFTYKEDKEIVAKALADMVARGIYPKNFF